MSERYKNEIEEILRQAGDLSTLGQSPARNENFLKLAWTQMKRIFGSDSWSSSSGRILLLSIGFLLSALVFKALVPGEIVALLLWSGLVMFIIGYAMFFLRPKRTEKRWRGRPVNDHPDTTYKLWHWKRKRRDE